MMRHWLGIAAAIIMLSQVCSAALVAEWDFDDSGNLGNDTAGVFNLSTGVGFTTPTFESVGVVGGAARFVDDSGFMTPADIYPNGSFSFAAWVKPSDTNITSVIMPFSRRGGFEIYAAGGKWRTRVWKHDLTYDLKVGPLIVTNDWTHLVLVYNKISGPDSNGNYTGTFRLWVNGVNLGGVDNAEYKADDSYTKSIGAHAQFEYRGLMDEMKIYDHALSAEEISALATIPISAPAQLPFLETFEMADGVAEGTLHGQNGWTVDGGTADVQSIIYQGGSQALEIKNGQVSHNLSSSASAIWLNFQARCSAAPPVNPSVNSENISLAFFVNTNLNLVVYSNAIPVELSAQLQTNIWTRFDIYCDYDDLYWDLSMDGVNVAAGLPLGSTNRLAGALAIENKDSSPVYIDQIDIADTEQTASGLPDSDNDNIPDWWEQKYFNGVTSVVAGDISGNTGLTYLQTYIAGVSPTYYDPFLISTVPSGFGLQWNPVPSRLYSVYWAQQLADVFVLQQELLYPQAEFIDLLHNEDPSGFYRLEVEVVQ